MRHPVVEILPAARAFTVLPGETILAAGLRAGFTFPRACRNGNCFRCEGRLLSGTVAHLRGGEPVLDGMVLPCVVTPLEDCALAVEGAYAPGDMPVVMRAAQVVGITQPCADVAVVRLRLPAGKPVARLAGQYLEIIDGDDAFAFSIASPPASGRDLELHVRFGEDNPSSLRVMRLLREERMVRVRLPLGECTLIREPRLPLLFVAGATGFSQVRAFVEHAIASGWRVPMTVYWGARRAGDLYQREIAEHWMREHANIRFVSVVSSAMDAMDDAPSGVRRGLVHEAVLADFPDLSGMLVYACGSPPMVYACLDAFVARGLPAERMFSDVFSWAPRPPVP